MEYVTDRSCKPAATPSITLAEGFYYNYRLSLQPKRPMTRHLKIAVWLCSLILAACAKPPSGTYVSGGQRKQVGTGKEAQIMEQNKFQEQEYITFLDGGKLLWKKDEDGVALQSEGTWKMKDDIVTVLYIYSGKDKMREEGDTIVYNLRKSKDNEGKEEFSLKSIKHNDSPFRPVPTVQNLWHTAFHKVD